MKKLKIIICDNVTMTYYLEKNYLDKNDTSLSWFCGMSSGPINAGQMHHPLKIEVQDMDIIKKYFKTEELE